MKTAGYSLLALFSLIIFTPTSKVKEIPQIVIQKNSEIQKLEQILYQKIDTLEREKQEIIELQKEIGVRK